MQKDISPNTTVTGEEVKTFREVVQSLCQVANPLGKVIDYLKEDTETMIKEQQFWIKDEKLHNSQLEEERRITEEMLQDEAGQVMELEDEIKYQQRRIFSLKAEILQNDDTIMKFLRMLTAPSSIEGHSLDSYKSSAKVTM